MQIEIDPSRSIEANAARYYEESKKYKKKLENIGKAIQETKKLILEEQKREEKAAAPERKTPRSKEWYEKFHWLRAGENLVLGGKDAASNEILVKKHLEKNDLFFHADVTGAPVIIVKDGQNAPKELLEEAAVFAAGFSRAWRSGRGTCDVYYARPEQVKTAAKAGEFLARGSFVIEGKREWFRNVELRLAVTFAEGKLLIGPENWIKKKPGKHILLVPDARKTKNETAKLVLKKMKELFPDAAVDIDWVQEILPNGGSRIL
jgi:predicted ribosome quality control (RQC) complex YloA/Tae2 family protein